MKRSFWSYYIDNLKSDVKQINFKFIYSAILWLGICFLGPVLFVLISCINKLDFSNFWLDFVNLVKDYVTSILVSIGTYIVIKTIYNLISSFSLWKKDK